MQKLSVLYHGAMISVTLTLYLLTSTDFFTPAPEPSPSTDTSHFFPIAAILSSAHHTPLSAYNLLTSKTGTFPVRPSALSFRFPDVQIPPVRSV